MSYPEINPFFEYRTILLNVLSYSHVVYQPGTIAFRIIYNFLIFRDVPLYFQSKYPLYRPRHVRSLNLKLKMPIPLSLPSSKRETLERRLCKLPTSPLTVKSACAQNKLNIRTLKSSICSRPYHKLQNILLSTPLSFCFLFAREDRAPVLKGSSASREAS